MSLIINTTSPAGMIIAADSRQTYRNKKGVVRIGSDNATKIFQLGDRIGIAVAGPAFLPENGIPKNISKFVEEFARNIDKKNATVPEVAEKIHKFFAQKYNYKEQLISLRDKVKNDLTTQGLKIKEIIEEESSVKIKFIPQAEKEQEITISVDVLSVIVCGYNPDGSHQAFTCYIPGEFQEKRNSEKRRMEYGANWIGQNDVVVRVIKGFDPRIEQLPFLQKDIKELGSQTIEQQLGGLEYAISWGTMTLQDAIDFSILIINTTAALQRFSDGIQADPGGIPGVGGPVDVAVITPNKGFIWVSKKSLKANNEVVDLEDFEDLSKQEEGKGKEGGDENG